MNEIKNVNKMNKVDIAGVAQTYRDGKFLDSQENKLVIFKGYHKIKKLKHIESEEYFKDTAEKLGWTVVYDFDWCDKIYEVYDRNSFKSIDEKNKTCILKNDAKCYDRENKTNIIVWAAYKKFEDFNEDDIKGCVACFESIKQHKYTKAIKEMGKQGKYCWIAYVAGNSFVNGCYNGLCDSVEEFMNTDFEMSRSKYFSIDEDVIEIGRNPLGWNSICLRPSGDRKFDCKLSKLGASKCAILQDLKRIRNNIKECFDKLCSCGWYATSVDFAGDYYCERVQFEKMLMGGEHGFLRGQVLKMGKGDEDWKFHIWHDMDGILGGIDDKDGIGKCPTCGYWCKAKWINETKGWLWLSEIEMEAWLGMIRELKMMGKMVAEE